MSPNFKNQDVLNKTHILLNLFSKCDYNGAIEIGTQLYGIFDENPQEKSSYFLICLNTLAISYEKIGNFKLAEEFFNSALKNAEIQYYANSTNKNEYAVALNNYARFLKNKGNLPKSENFYLKCLELFKDNKDSDFQSYSKLLINIAAFYKQCGDLKKCRYYHEKLKIIIEKNKAESTIINAAYLNNVAQLEMLRSNFDAAEPLFFRSLTILEENCEKFATYLGEIHGNIALLFVLKNDFDQSKTYFTRSLSIFENIFATSSIEYASVLVNFGNLLLIMGNIPEAEENYTKGIDILNRILGTKNSKIAACFNNLAYLNLQKGDMIEVETNYHNALQSIRDGLNEIDPYYYTIINNFGSHFESIGKYSLAEFLYKQSIDFFSENISLQCAPDEMQDYHHIQNYEHLASMLSSIGQNTEAIQNYEKSLVIKAKIYGDNTPEYAITLEKIASLHLNLQNTLEAESLFTKILDIRNKFFGENNVTSIRVLKSLADLYFILDKKDLSEKYYIDIVKKWEKYYPHNSIEYAKYLDSLATLYYSQGRIPEAENLSSKSLDMRMKILGKTHPDIEKNIHFLMNIYRDTNSTNNYNKMSNFLNQVGKIRGQMLRTSSKGSITNLARKENHLENNIEIEDSDIIPQIFIVGCGNAGNNTINRLFHMVVDNTTIIGINTDKSHLDLIQSDKKILIGRTIADGEGANGDPEVGRLAAEVARPTLENVLESVDLCFVTAGMGGGTGTGSAPVIAQIAKEQGGLVIGVVSLPFDDVEKARLIRAKEGLEAMLGECDSVIVLDINRLNDFVPNLPIDMAFSVMDQLICEMIKNICNTLTQSTLVNIDIDDLCFIMKKGGVATLMLGESKQQNKVELAVKECLSPQNVMLNVDYRDASGVVINIIGGSDLTLMETEEIASSLCNELDPHADVIWGAQIHNDLEGKLRITAILTGLNKENIITGLECSYGGHSEKSEENIRSPKIIEILSSRTKSITTVFDLICGPEIIWL